MGAGAGKFLGVRKILAQNFPNLPKKLQKMSLPTQEKSLHVIWSPFFSNQSTMGAIFARIFREFAEIIRGFTKVFTYFAQISTILSVFWGILPGFSPNQNFWGCTCTPASYTTEAKDAPVEEIVWKI